MVDRYRRCRVLSGVIAPPKTLAFGSIAKVKLPAQDEGGMRDWYMEGVPTDAQRYPSCVGRATAQMLMALIRREHGRQAIPRGKWINGDTIWRKAREMFYRGNLDGGLLLHQGIAAAEALGIVTKGSYEVIRPDLDLDQIDRYLALSPLIQGTSTWAAWNDPNGINGQIRVGKPDPLAGHATTIFDVTRRGRHSYAVFANSWGKSWGRYGYGILTASQVATASLDRPLGVYFPDGMGRGWVRHLEGI